MLGASAAFVAMQVTVKLARERGMDTSEVMFLRTAPGLPLLWWSLRKRGEGIVPREPVDVVTRSLLGTCAMATNFAAMSVLTLAQFSTLGLTNPVFVAFTSPWVLGERPRAHRWIALPLAAAGALVFLVPGLESRRIPATPALLGLSSAMFSAFAQMWVRKATANDPPERVVFHFAAFASVLSLGIGAARGHFRHLPPEMSIAAFALLTSGMAGFGTLGQVLMTRAYSHGEATTVAMVGYSGIALSMLADLLLWRVWPAPTALAGAVLMLAAGIVLVRGERRLTDALTIASPRPPDPDSG
jgi:drug/metabolite transporter (DMT)-like permease